MRIGPQYADRATKPARAARIAAGRDADYWFMQTQRVPTQPHRLTNCQLLPSHSYL